MLYASPVTFPCLLLGVVFCDVTSSGGGVGPMAELVTTAAGVWCRGCGCCWLLDLLLELGCCGFLLWASICWLRTNWLPDAEDGSAGA